MIDFRPACAFLNAGRGGTVYVGLKKTGLVYGVEVSRKQVSEIAIWSYICMLFYDDPKVS